MDDQTPEDRAERFNQVANSVLGTVAEQTGNSLGDTLGAIGTLARVAQNPLGKIAQNAEAKRTARALVAGAIDPKTGLPPIPTVVANVPPPAAVTAAMGEPQLVSRTPMPAAPGPAKSAPAAVPAAGAVDTTLAPETQELQDYEAKQAISGVHDAATDAKRAEDARQAKEEAEALGALDAEKKARLAAQPGFFKNFVSALATGKNAEAPHVMTPLEELTKKREILGQLQKEREERETKARGQALLDPNSDLTKTSAMSLRALGVPVPKGYTASMFNDMKELAKLGVDQRKEAAHATVETAKARETERADRASESLQRQRLALEGATKAAAGKPLSDKELESLTSQKLAPELLQQVGDVQKEVGPSGVLGAITPEFLHFGKQRELDELKKAAAESLVPGVFAGARPNETLAKAIEHQLPTGLETKEMAANKLAALGNTLRRKNATQVQALGAAGVNPTELQALTAGPAPAAAGRVKVVGPNGERGTMLASELAQHPGWRAQ